jgi:hypothetical protein
MLAPASRVQHQYAHTRLRVHWAPGIPRALVSRAEISGKARAKARRENENVSVVIARSDSDEAIHLPFAAPWIASLRSQ